MADLSAVLRKTIDGLPRAGSAMRAKVYEKARAAIAKQIAAANPPLSDDVVEARQRALEDAIARTEAHYAFGEPDAADEPPREAAFVPAPVHEPVRAFEPQAADNRPEARPQPAPEPRAPTGEPAPRIVPPPARPVPPPAGRAPSAPDRPRVEPTLSPPPPAPPVPGAERAGAPVLPPVPVLPAGIEPRDRPDTVDAPFALGEEAARNRRATSRLDPPRIASTEPAAGLDEGAIPAADLTAPRQTNAARRARAKSRTPIAAGIALLLAAGAGTAAYLYLDDIRSALGIAGSATVANTADTPGADGAPADPVAGEDEPSEGETDVAAVPDAAAPATPSTPAGTSEKRRFTQRLLPDGTEVDEGPGASIVNAFEEGTNIAAASPPTAEPQPAIAAPVATPDAQTPSAAAPPAAPQTETAAAQPTTPGSATTLAVAQKAVFYEERSETEAGTQRGGNVVWSVVQEPPAEGQPAEPAIRAVADVPEENLKLTLTIRRNTDATLPASHVIELMFETPPNFPGGSIANVQRLALKPTEQARGEPLIGVAGKISDGFFIIALNNLSEATNTNLDLLNKEQWIDIPIAYATGRRALMSIEKGIPGDRAFKTALDAWGGKT